MHRLHYSSIEELDSFSLNDLIIDSMILQIWNKCDSIVRTNEAISSIIDASGGSHCHAAVNVSNNYRICSRCSK